MTRDTLQGWFGGIKGMPKITWAMLYGVLTWMVVGWSFERLVRLERWQSGLMRGFAKPVNS